MAISIRRFFGYGLLFLAMSAALFVSFQQYGDNFRSKLMKRLDSERSLFDDNGSSLEPHIHDLLYEEERLKTQTQEILQLESINNKKFEHIVTLLQYLVNSRNHNDGTDLVLPSALKSPKLERNDHLPRDVYKRLNFKQKPACTIPNLDPFSDEAKYHIEDVEKRNCYEENYVIVENGILKLRRSDIRDVLIRYIRRAENDDFKIDFTEFLSILKHGGKINNLDTETTGCLTTKNGYYLGFTRENSKSIGIPMTPAQWTKSKNCTPENYIQVLENGVIKELMTSQCVAVVDLSGNDEDNLTTTFEIEFTDDCREEAAIFKIHSSGVAEHGNSNKCLAVKEKDTDIVALELIDNCNGSEAELKVYDFPPQDVDISFPITEEFVEVLIAERDFIHSEHHIQVKAKENIIETLEEKRIQSKLDYNVAFLMFDSQSAANFERKLTKTFNFLKNDNNSIIFKGHTINGDGTTAQLCALFVGMLEENLPEARRGHVLSNYVDKWPFIFKRFSDKGYVTMFSEDDAQFASFNYRLKGFQHQPTDHYARPFWIGVEEKVYNGHCVGGKKTFEIGLNYTMNFYEVYRKALKFSFTSFSFLFHNEMNEVQSSDDAIFEFLHEFKRKGYVAETILILFADHGLRTSNFRDSIQGKLEERLPFMSITLPPSMINDHPEIYQALKHNSDVLTTHFDTHATLQHILVYPMQPHVSTGQSLFTYINQSLRTCASAGVKDHWCPCLEFSNVKVTDENVIEGVKFVLKYINDEIIGKNKEAKRKCSVLRLKLIKRARIQLPGEAVRTFEKTFETSKCDECGVVKSEKSEVNPVTKVYELVFSVEPSHGIYETTVTKHGIKWMIGRDISRLNLYHDQPKCIQEKYPELRKFCYCK